MAPHFSDLERATSKSYTRKGVCGPDTQPGKAEQLTSS
jgi:hypothetical protein